MKRLGSNLDILLKIDKNRAINTMIKHFDGQGNAFFGKPDDVLHDITKLVAGTGIDNPEEAVDSMFEDWEKDSILTKPYIFVEMNNEGVDRLEGYQDDVQEILDDIEPYLNSPAIIDEIR